MSVHVSMDDSKEQGGFDHAYLRVKSVGACLCNHKDGPGEDLEGEHPVHDRTCTIDFDVGICHLVANIVAVGHLKNLEGDKQGPSDDGERRHKTEKDPVDGRDPGIGPPRIGQTVQKAVDQVVEDVKHQAAAKDTEKVVEHHVDAEVFCQADICQEENLVDDDEYRRTRESQLASSMVVLGHHVQ